MLGMTLPRTGFGLAFKRRGSAIAAGIARSAGTLLRTSGVTTYPVTADLYRAADWVDGDKAVMQRSQDPTFTTGVFESAVVTLAASTTTNDFGLAAAITSGIWYFKIAAWSGIRPAVLNWTNIQGVGDSGTPTITSSAAPSGFQFIASSLALTASKPSTFAIVGGFDMAVFSYANGVLSWPAQSASGTLTVQVQATSYCNVPSAIQTIVLTVAVNTADVFTFTDETGVALSTTKTSNEITVNIPSGSSLPVSGGPYIKTPVATGIAAAVSSAATTAVTGDKFKMQLLSSASYLTASNAPLTIGSTSDTYTVTTMADPAAVPAFAWTANPAMVDGGHGPSAQFTGVAIGPADTTRNVIVFMTDDDNLAGDSMTIGGVTATLRVSTLDLFIYQAAVPTGTTANIVLNRAAGIGKVVIQVATIVNYNPTPSSTGSVAFGFSDPNSVTPSIPAGGVAIGALVAEGAALTITVSAGTAGLQTQSAAPARTMRGASRTTAGNLTFAGQGGGGNCLVYAVFQP